MAIFSEILEQSAKVDIINLTDEIIKELKNKLIIQGHSERNVDGLINSFTKEIQITATYITAEVYAFNYWFYLNRGVSADRIPYNEGSGKKKSLYIEGLIKFFKKKVKLSEKNAKSAAFATAKVHKKEGMPTRNSYRFSKNGFRTKFVDNALAEIDKKLSTLFTENYSKSVEQAFNAMIDRNNLKFQKI